MKNFLFFLLFISCKISAQDCSLFTTSNSFNPTVNVNLFMEGRGESYPYVNLSVIINPTDKSLIQINCNAGRGLAQHENTYNNDKISLSGQGQETDNSISARLARNIEKNETSDVFIITQLRFIFDDGQAFFVYSEPPVISQNVIFLQQEKNTELFNHFKSNKLTDIKVVFSSMNADYKLPLLNSFDPKSNQDFFINLFKCNGC